MAGPVGFGVVIDCADPDALAAFWAPALGYVHLGTADPYALLAPPEGTSGPKLLLQRVAEPKQGKNRMHLDVETSDPEAKVAELEALGARRLDDTAYEEMGHRWYVMADPEGNEFCVCAAAGSGC